MGFGAWQADCKATGVTRVTSAEHAVCKVAAVPLLRALRHRRAGGRGVRPIGGALPTCSPMGSVTPPPPSAPPAHPWPPPTPKLQSTTILPLTQRGRYPAAVCLRGPQLTPSNGQLFLCPWQTRNKRLGSCPHSPTAPPAPEHGGKPGVIWSSPLPQENVFKSWKKCCSLVLYL